MILNMIKKNKRKQKQNKKMCWTKNYSQVLLEALLMFMFCWYIYGSCYFGELNFHLKF